MTVAQAIGGKLVNVGGFGFLVAVTTDPMKAVVLAGEPEDVGLVLGRANRGEDEQEKNGE